MNADALTPQFAFLAEYLDLAEATGDMDARWEVFQIQHLNNRALLAITDKSRQVGWSWLAAAEATATAALFPRSTEMFISINLAEAQEKIRYAKAVIEALDVEVRPRLIIDNRLELELENGSRLISHPCRPVRGKARVDLYLDEFAHYPKDREIYQSAVPVITKGGKIRIGSSPLGAGGLFWEIYTEELRAYPGYVRRMIPWWAIRALSKDLKMARVMAPAMTTDERVQRFGTPRLIQIYENLPLEDFQQEYECLWVDESVAWIDWDLIKKNQRLAQDEKLWYRQAQAAPERAGGVDACMRAIDEVAYASFTGEIEPVLSGGLDVGRKRDLSELTLTGKTTTGDLPYRLGLSLERLKFDDQLAICAYALDRLPVTALLIDQNGIGMQLAETLSARFPTRAQGVDFTNPSKELWAVETKLQFQRGKVPIPLSRELSYQIHSIKKTVTAAKNNVFDTARNEQHHADKFWSLALAIWAARSEGGSTISAGANPLNGYRG